MFTKKEINIFDKDKVKIGSFITFCKVQKDYENGVIFWDDYTPQNGIINVVTETYIEVCTINKKYEIFLQNLIGSPAFDERAHGDFYKILGIIPNAIKKEEN